MPSGSLPEARQPASSLPRIALTAGDPAGIGPEITVRAALDPTVLSRCRPLVVASRETVERALSATGLQAVVCDEPGERSIALSATAQIRATIEYGRVQAAAGQAAWVSVERATRLALDGDVAAVVTAPLNKEALMAAGAPSIDHTTGFARLTGSADVLTMFVVGRLRIVFATRHTSLRQACDELTTARLVSVLQTSNRWLQAQGMAAPRFAVAALNPHAGEGGLFGRDEIEVIAPAIEAAWAAGVRVTGPVAADSVFHQCLQGRHDMVVALYHDQGHIAAKTYDFERTVAVTSGLPFVRTSVDHGTAYDLAGSGRASAVSMIEAVLVAADLVTGRWGEEAVAWT